MAADLAFKELKPELIDGSAIDMAADIMASTTRISKRVNPASVLPCSVNSPPAHKIP
jgi:hypothetical protein